MTIPGGDKLETITSTFDFTTTDATATALFTPTSYVATATPSTTTTYIDRETDSMDVTYVQTNTIYDSTTFLPTTSTSYDVTGTFRRRAIDIFPAPTPIVERRAALSAPPEAKYIMASRLSGDFCTRFRSECSSQCSSLKSSTRSTTCRATNKKTHSYMLGCECRNGKTVTGPVVHALVPKKQVVSVTQAAARTKTATGVVVSLFASLWCTGELTAVDEMR